MLSRSGALKGEVGDPDSVAYTLCHTVAFGFPRRHDQFLSLDLGLNGTAAVDDLLQSQRSLVSILILHRHNADTILPACVKNIVVLDFIQPLITESSCKAWSLIRLSLDKAASLLFNPGIGG